MSEETEIVPGDVDDEPKGEEQQPVEETGGEEQQPLTTEQITSLNELAAAIGVEPAYIYGLKMRLSDSGEEVPLGQAKDLIQKYQREQAKTAEIQAALEAERQAIAQHAQFVQGVTKEVAEAQRQIALAEADFERIDWERFEALDPGKAANERQKLMARYMAGKEKLQTAQAQAEQSQRQQAELLRQSRDAELLQVMPQWRDQEVARKELNETVQWALRQGFTEQELASAPAARHIVTLYKAAMYDAAMAAKPAAVTQIKPLPGGRVPGREEISRSKTDALVRKAQQTRRPGDKIAAAKAILDRGLK